MTNWTDPVYYNIMAKRTTVLPHGEHSTARNNAQVLRKRSTKKIKTANAPIKRSHPVQKKGKGRYGTAVYRPEYAGEAQRLAQSGRNLTEIAQYFKVSVDLIRRWMREHEDFGRGVGYGKVDLQNKALKSLEKLIQGPEQVQTTRKYHEDGSVQITGEKVIKHEPDIHAIQFYLTAHDPQMWAAGKLGGDSSMTLVTSMALVNAIMKRIPQTERGAMPPPEYPSSTYSVPAVIEQVSKEDATRIHPE